MASLNDKIGGQKFASISESAAGDATVVAAVAGKRIRVTNYTLNAAGGVATVIWKSGSTVLSGAMDMADNGNLIVSASGGGAAPMGIIETAKGEALVLNKTGITLLAGHISYLLV